MGCGQEMTQESHHLSFKAECGMIKGSSRFQDTPEYISDTFGRTFRPPAKNQKNHQAVIRARPDMDSATSK